MTVSGPPSHPPQIAVLMPVRDDWPSAAELIRRLDQTFSTYPCNLRICLVDDGSNAESSPGDFSSAFGRVSLVETVRLRRNLGHQRAIAIGLVHIQQTILCNAVLVMDADGEDTAEGALELVRTFFDRERSSRAVFAARSRRTESLVFRAFYQLYKALHLLLTGISVRVGNFSILPYRYLDTLVVMPELWNHYAAAVFRSGLRFTTIPIERGHRITGASKMSFVSLASHGLSAISVFADIVGVRLIMASIASGLLAVVSIFFVVFMPIFTHVPVPAWADWLTGIFAILVIQFIATSTSFTFTMLSGRTKIDFVPLRDYEIFLAETRDLYRA